ncbi:50S ribosomal protein L16 3-hydroxylase [BD1-7 clade bacterium]|uniref:50S ribosomal protein L16 3-hydroxylase n=1 Tax=BD1-7 clade bacterium TaxID=2029982 RepID=A0A5S9QYQ9_9GAMM|nr:50S ribosomal protein L16 3-hydroxylase [BD1-7 clade bacterium]
MTGFCLNNFDETSFLKEHWQKQPLLLNEAIADFTSPISSDELAGLALEEFIESRIIFLNDDGEYDVLHGPFEAKDYQQLEGKQWTLLVQAVDHYVEEIEELKSLFRFIPDWRLDDIMISFAPTGGGVGPHFDQYDVFLLQAQGKRLWKLGQHCDDNTPLADNPDVQILESFETENEFVLEPGDVLYVPPGKAHWGLAETDDCITISIGFRAPSLEELIANLCDDVASRLPDSIRYQDNDLGAQAEGGHPTEITQATINRIKQVVAEQLLDDQRIAESFAGLMTQTKYGDLEADDEMTQVLRKNPESRMAYYVKDDNLMVFANGYCSEITVNHLEFIQGIADSHYVELDGLNDDQTAIVEELFDLGFYLSCDADFGD